MTIDEKKYRKRLDELIDKSMEACLNEVFDSDYDMPEIDNLSQFRYKHAGGLKGKEFKTAVASNNFTPKHYGPLVHGWRTVTAVNGMMGWVDRNGRNHPIMDDIGWLDQCTNFSSGRSAIATGMKDNIRYYAYKDGNYEKDSKRFVRRTTDINGNTNTYDDIADGVVNHDGTATTHEITTNVRTALNPQGKWDPNKLLRYVTKDKRFFMEFVMVWSQHFVDKSQYKTGFNDEDGTFFIDIENGPGVYNAVVELDNNLGSSIRMNQIDRETWNQRNRYNGASGRFFEGYVREDGESENPASDPKELTNGSIVFGKNIPFDNDEGDGGQTGLGGQVGQQQPNQSFEIETMQIDYYGFFNNTTAKWVLRIDQGLWLSAEDGSKMGTVKVEPNLAQWNFTLTHNNGNQFNFVIRDNQFKDSGRGYEVATNIQLFYSTPNTMSKNRGIGAMDIIYTHKMKDNINLFETRVYRTLTEKLRRLNERTEMMDGAAVWDLYDALSEAGLNEEECGLCSALDDTYTIRFSGSRNSGGWDTPDEYTREPNRDDVHEVEFDINAIPDNKVKSMLMSQFHKWLETAEPDMDYAEGPDPDRYRDEF